MVWRGAAMMGAAMAALTACGGPAACPLEGERPMLAVTLYFGAGLPGGGTVSDADWAAFARRELTPLFPDGFTMTAGHGQWRNPATQAIGAEATRIVRIDIAPAADWRSRVAAVQAAYRKQFRQIAVGVETAPVCASF